MSRSLGATRFTTRSPILTSPVVRASSPAARRSAVVFPEPEVPTSTTNSPSEISRENSFSAWTSPNAFPTSSYVTVAIASALHRAREDASDELPLREDEHDQDRERDDHRSRRDEWGVADVLALEDVQACRGRQELVLRREHQSEEELVPRVGEREDHERQDRRPRERHHDPPEHLPGRRAVHARRLQKRRRRRQEGGAHPEH